MDKVDAVAASGLASAAILATLVAALQARGLLSPVEVTGVYEHALLLLDEMRATTDDPTVVDVARALIEDELRVGGPEME